MKLIDGIKDEKLGLALLYCFTKGYGKPVPINLYDYALALLFDEVFTQNIKLSQSYEECVEKSLEEKPAMFDDINDQFDSLLAIVNKTLGLAVIEQMLGFEPQVDGVYGVLKESNVLDFNEAITLGKWMNKLTLDEVKETFKKQAKQVVVLDAISLGDDIDLQCFNEFGKLKVYQTTSKDELYERIKDASYVLTNKVILDQEILSQLNKLEYIGILATGLNNVDLEYCKLNGITVQNVEGYSSFSVAQHTLTLLLYLYEKLSYYDNYVKSGQYQNSNCFTHIGQTFNQLNGKTWGIVGMGKIGEEVAKIASAFNCKVVYFSTSGKNHRDDYQQVSFEQLLSDCDIISIHAPLNENTYHLFDHKAFAKMKRSAYIINVGRGAIINEEDLAFALKHRLIAGAGLDVLEQEPMKPNHPLEQINDSTRLLITPHMAWASIEARNLLIKQAYNHLNNFTKNK